MEKRIQKEKEFHNERFEKDSRKHLDKYYSVTQNSRALYLNFIKSDIENKTILEYGCGEGSFSFELALLGANVFGIDISEIAITKSMVKAEDKGLSDRMKFSVMNAEELTFGDDFFDRICGVAILHHLNLEKSLKELARVMKPDGDGVFLEPLGHNPFINLYRSLTKKLRTEDEHPLLMSDLELFNKYFSSVEIYYFHLTSLLTVPFRNLKNFSSIVNLFDKIDKVLFRIPFFRKNAWQIVIKLSKPNKI
ncbi:MAG: class I SAM-dependent methyltransferase [Ignavibacteriaceae bacterium]|jgi:ubiquinone/menaquinone biosynthesis C-methylase UbiE